MQFIPKTIEEELGILFYDFIFNEKKFLKTKEYIEPLIDQVVFRFEELSKEKKDDMVESLIKKIDITAENYIKH